MSLKISILLCAIFLGCLSQAQATQLEQAQALFYQGNTDYGQENFKQAVADYEGALTLGLASGELYYNLGNVYFKLSRLGKAILNYSRAKRLIPRDADLKANLKFAQSQIEGGYIEPKRNWFIRNFFDLADFFSLNELTLFSAILYFLLALSATLLIIIKRLRRTLKMFTCLIAVVLLVFASLFLIRLYYAEVLKQAVVITEQTFSKFEPFEDATVYFNLYEGETVTIIDVKDDWVKLRRSDGRSGWVRQAQIELL